MMPIHTILHPTDLTEASRNAFHFACGLARDYDAQLIVLHVRSLEPLVAPEVVLLPQVPDDEQRSKLHTSLSQLQPTGTPIQISHRLEDGDPVNVILEIAADISADLIVVGTHGLSGIKRLLLGSVAEQILREASCPVVTVKSTVPAKAPQSALVAHAPIPVELAQAV